MIILLPVFRPVFLLNAADREGDGNFRKAKPLLQKGALFGNVFFFGKKHRDGHRRLVGIQDTFVYEVSVNARKTLGVAHIGNHHTFVDHRNYGGNQVKVFGLSVNIQLCPTLFRHFSASFLSRSICNRNSFCDANCLSSRRKATSEMRISFP